MFPDQAPLQDSESFEQIAYQSVLEPQPDRLHPCISPQAKSNSKLHGQQICPIQCSLYALRFTLPVLRLCTPLQQVPGRLPGTWKSSQLLLNDWLLDRGIFRWALSLSCVGALISNKDLVIYDCLLISGALVDSS